MLMWLIPHAWWQQWKKWWQKQATTTTTMKMTMVTTMTMEMNFRTRNQRDKGWGSRHRLCLEPQVCFFFFCHLFLTKLIFYYSLLFYHLTTMMKERGELEWGHDTSPKNYPQVTMTCDLWVGFYPIYNTTNESLWLVSGFWLTPTHNTGPKNHPQVMITHGQDFIPSSTPTASCYDLLVGFNSLPHMTLDLKTTHLTTTTTTTTNIAQYPAATPHHSLLPLPWVHNNKVEYFTLPHIFCLDPSGMVGMVRVW